MTKQSLMALAVLLVLLLQATANTDVLSTPSRSFVTLYAHARPPSESGQGPILNAIPKWGQQQAANLQKGEAAFTLDPPLGERVVIDGTTTIRIWVRADIRLVGFLAVYLTENTPDGRSILANPMFNDTVFLDIQPRDINYLVAINNFTLVPGSVLQLHVALASTNRVTGAYLLYDALTTPSQIAVPTEGVTNANIDLFNQQGNPRKVFETTEESTNTTLTVRTNITDALGLYRLRSIVLSISNSNGTVFFTSNMLGVLQVLNDYSGLFETNLTIPQGTYTVAVTTTDQSGNLAVESVPFFVSVFFTAMVKVTDSAGSPIVGAKLTAVEPYSNYSALTNQTGWASVRVPSSEIVGLYQVVVSWGNLTILTAAGLPVYSNVVYSAVASTYDLDVRVRVLFFDLPSARVDLLSNGTIVSSNVTNSTGRVVFPNIPPGDYVVAVHYLGVDSETNVVVEKVTSTIIQVPVPFQDYLPYAIALIAILGAVTIVQRRRRVYGVPFDYVTQLTKGDFPDSLTTTIIGTSGSGKTVLVQLLADRSLKEQRGCVYVTNVELPDNVRKAMTNFGMSIEESEANGKLLFIDCYSALSGSRPTEKRALSSFTDLTSLGILITTAIEDMHGPTDVYFDSITPLFTTLKTDYVVSFLQSIGAKVKSNNGRLFATIGTSLEKGIVNRVEELSDCVIETRLMESRGGQKRRLRVKKLRAHSYSDAWTQFTIDEKGITFLARKPYSADSKVK
jgi:KaiC/GvpD/RAD55 family RecA-like ATPase